MDTEIVEQTALAFILDSVREIAKQHPTESIYGAMFHCFYGDGTYIYYPPLSVGTEELLEKVVQGYRQNGSLNSVEELTASLRWSGADLSEYMFEATETLEDLAECVTEFASEQEAEKDWAKVYNDFLLCFPRACKKATTALRNEGIVADNFLAVATDDEGLLIPLSMSRESFEKHFPEYAK